MLIMINVYQWYMNDYKWRINIMIYIYIYKLYVMIYIYICMHDTVIPNSITPTTTHQPEFRTGQLGCHPFKQTVGGWRFPRKCFAS